MTQFKSKRRLTEVIIWLIITDRFHARLLAIVYARERANEIHECVFLFPVSHSSRVAILSRALSYFSPYAIIADKISQFHKSFVWYSLSNLLRKQKGADFRGARTIEVVKVWKLVYFRSLRPSELPIKKSTVVHIRDFFIRRVLTVVYYLSPYRTASEERRTNTVPILWPVVSGTNRISSHQFQKTLYLQKEYSCLTWHKCIAHCQSRHDHIWQRIARLNNKGAIRYYNGTHALYTLFNNGILEIRNVTVADNYTEYRSEVRSAWDVDAEHVLLLFYENEGKKVCNSFFFLA